MPQMKTFLMLLIIVGLVIMAGGIIQKYRKK
jgi:hypothetical protein